MEARAKLWMKRLTTVSLVLILLGVASYWKSAESWDKKTNLDNEENYLIKLEAGEQGGVDLSTIGYYVAFRINGTDSSPELKLTDNDGVEIEGEEPGWIYSINYPDSQGNLIYVPIRVFEIKDTGEYNILNEGNTTLWLIDNFEMQLNLLSDGWMIISLISCCLGFPLGIITLIGGLILWRRNRQFPEKKIIIQRNIMTTDELFKKHNMGSLKEIPEPFISTENIEPAVLKEKFDVVSEIKNEEKDSLEDELENWKKWDDG
jgi:hypothetical protein